MSRLQATDERLWRLPVTTFRSSGSRVQTPTEKRFPLQLDAGSWHTDWVAEENGLIRGFLAVGYNPWNRRLIIWHFYVDRVHRQRGIGRLLLQNIFAEASSLGATTAWLETMNVNYPRVMAYKKLGFDLCGFDLTLYRETPNEGEFGLFLARSL